ncbi:MAG: fused response regulator/phosphatase [Sideroxydans sp.]|nr:fused response regulator/phosphatase [Sideroxydans sp.]
MPVRKPLRILVVDDERTNIMVMQAMLGKMGHEVLTARSGQDAVALLSQEKPNVVLMDVMMPVMSGYDTVRLMRKMPEGNIPIIFVTALNRTEDIIEGVEAGGDDYLHKPVHYELLRAKINALHERQGLLYELAQQNTQLLEHRSFIEEERKSAVSFSERLAALDRANDPAVKHYLRHAEDFGGDLIAVARTPDNSLHVMLADSAGHGLIAALSIFPVVEPFYKMTAKGFDIASIVVELNKRVRKYTGLPNYVAVNLVSIDLSDGSARVWNGGCPDALLISEQGAILHRFVSAHFPLGVMPEKDFDNTFERYDFGSTKCKLFLTSDGLTELSERDAVDFDFEQLLCHQCRDLRYFDDAMSTLANKLDAHQISDDIALIAVSCEMQEGDAHVTSHPVSAIASEVDLEHSPEHVSWRMNMSLTCEQLKGLDVVPMLMNVTNTIEPSNDGGTVFMVLSELFNNALDHGILKLESELKHHDDGLGQFFEERASRLEKLTHGQIDIALERIDMGGLHLLRISVRDSGDGFDYQRIFAQQETEHQRHGRGLRLVQGMSDKLEFFENGAQVVAWVSNF